MEGESACILVDGVTCITVNILLIAMLKWGGSTKYDIITNFMSSSNSGKFKTQ